MSRERVPPAPDGLLFRSWDVILSSGTGHLHTLLGIPPTGCLTSRSSLKIKRAAELSVCFIARRESCSDNNAESHFPGRLVGAEWNLEVEALWPGNPSLARRIAPMRDLQSCPQ